MDADLTMSPTRVRLTTDAIYAKAFALFAADNPKEADRG